VDNVVKQCRMRTMGSSQAKRDDNAQALPAGRGETESVQHGPVSKLQNSEKSAFWRFFRI